MGAGNYGGGTRGGGEPGQDGQRTLFCLTTFHQHVIPQDHVQPIRHLHEYLPLPMRQHTLHIPIPGADKSEQNRVHVADWRGWATGSLRVRGRLRARPAAWPRPLRNRFFFKHLKINCFTFRLPF